MRGPSSSRLVWLAILGLLPWSWFLLRDRFGVVTDVVAIILVPLVLGLVCFAVAAGIRWRPALLVAGTTVIMGVLAVGLPWLPADAGQVAAGKGVKVASASVGPGDAEAAEALLGVRADVLVVEELGYRLHVKLRPSYPYGLAFFDGSSVSVYSRYPYRVLEEPSSDLPGVRLEVDGPSGPFILYALHVPRPWVRNSLKPYQATIAEHRRLIALAADRAAGERLPVVVVGDLNAPDRTSDYRVLLDRGKLTDAMRDAGVGVTSIGAWTPLLLRIDHLLVGTGWCGDAAHQFAVPAADHRGITAAVGPCAEVGP